jgi:hypothetical protein
MTAIADAVRWLKKKAAATLLQFRPEGNYANLSLLVKDQAQQRWEQPGKPYQAAPLETDS